MGADVASPHTDICKLDCTGKCAAPGLFDCHTHLAFLQTMGKTTLKTKLESLVQNGITQLRDVKGPIDVLYEISQAVSRGEILGPKLFYTGPLLEKPPLRRGELNEAGSMYYGQLGTWLPNSRHLNEITELSSPRVFKVSTRFSF